MKKLSFIPFLVAVVVFALPACGQKKPLSKNYEKAIIKESISTPEDSLFYAFGYNIASDILGFAKKNEMIDQYKLSVFLRGIVDGHYGNTDIFNNKEEAFTFSQKKNIEISKKMTDKAVENEKAFFEENKIKEGVKEVKNGQGIQYIILKKGSGTSTPTLEDEVECHYVGTLIDGTEFDNSVKRGQPAKFPLGGVIKGWQLALSQMTEGAKWKIFIPSKLGYGARGAGANIPPNSTLIFEVELIKINKKKN